MDIKFNDGAGVILIEVRLTCSNEDAPAQGADELTTNRLPI